MKKIKQTDNVLNMQSTHQLPGLARWLSYFEGNRGGIDTIDWGAPSRLSEAERACIGRSMAKFQLGEYSEGRSLMRFARDYARRSGSDALVRITQHFIREEQHHALMLQRFMERHGLSRLRRNWTDTVFRRLRRDAGYELSITVLITAEIIALTYYSALKRCTESELLHAICARILAEERAHVEYESMLIRHIRGRHGAFRRGLTVWGHRCLFAGTVAVVYADHRKALRRGGYGPRAFWHACWRDFRATFP